MKFCNIFSQIWNRKSSNYIPNEPEEISSFRRYLPQIIASSAKNLIAIDHGFSLAFPTILIPALMGLNSGNNLDETITITPDQATWIASITVICQPIGSIVSGFMTEPFGRKFALMFVNIPFFIGWILLYYGNSLETIYIAVVLLGLGIGLMEAPIYTYIGEICEPTLRGILTAAAGIASAVGSSLVFFLGNEMSFRYVALICSIIPLLTAFLISFMPETPFWLLSRNRPEDALKSLQWLRGWSNTISVQIEFNELQSSRIAGQTCDECEKQHEICQHPPPTIIEKFRDLFRRRTLYPFLLIGSLYFLSAVCAFNSYRPYIVQVLYFYRTPIDANEVVTWMGYVGFFGAVLLVCFVHQIGKRLIYLWSLAIIVISQLILGMYGFIYLPLNSTSFEVDTNSTTLHNDVHSRRYIPIIAFGLLQFFGNFATTTIPNILMAEVFPFKSKSFATGLTVPIFYLTSFISSKTFYMFELLLTLPGLAVLNGVIGIFGFIGIYLMLPETEGYSLEEIDQYFSNSRRKFNDIHISRRERHA